MSDDVGSLDELAGKLRDVVGDDDGHTIDQLLDEIRNRNSRIAVLGQIKAGKSSFVNAFVGRPDLLPVDVNPWTAVATHIHLGLAQMPPHQAVFQFFDRAEWDNIIGADDRLSQIIERFGLEAEQRAAGRKVEQETRAVLGSSFEHLLGKRHKFASIDAECLERYLCFGDVDAPSTGKAEAAPPKRFAHLTKTADLYLDHAIFDGPTVVIDTPGLNDSFLFREEVTRALLDEADLYIVVINAQQTLATTDLDLLRQLHGLHKDRIVLFVNRIDLLNDVVGDSARIEDHVQAVLAKEFPQAPIKVVIGSVHWAHLGLGGDESALMSSDILTPSNMETATVSMLAYARDRELVDGLEIEVGDLDAKGLRSLFLACSGVPKIMQLATDLVRFGSAARMKRLAGRLSALALIHRLALEDEAQALDALIQSARASTRDLTDQVDDLRSQEKEIDVLLNEMSTVEEGLVDDLGVMKRLTLEKLRVAFDRIIDGFADRQVKELDESLRQSAFSKVWHCETGEVRSALERVFLSVHRELVADMDLLQRHAADQLTQKLVDRLAGAKDVDLIEGSFNSFDQAPTIKALGQPLIFDLKRSWRDRWQAWRPSSDLTARLDRLIRSELAVVADELVASMADDIDRYSGITRQRLMDTSTYLVEGLRRERQALLQSCKALAGQDVGASNEGTIVDFEAKAGRLEQRLNTLRAIQGDLSTFENEMAIDDDQHSPTGYGPTDHAAPG